MVPEANSVDGKKGGSEIDSREHAPVSLTSRRRARSILVTIDIGDDDREDENREQATKTRFACDVYVP